jgi:hypothetical protein
MSDRIDPLSDCCGECFFDPLIVQASLSNKLGLASALWFDLLIVSVPELRTPQKCLFDCLALKKVFANHLQELQIDCTDQHVRPWGR